MTQKVLTRRYKTTGDFNESFFNFARHFLVFQAISIGEVSTVSVLLLITRFSSLFFLVYLRVFKRMWR